MATAVSPAYIRQIAPELTTLDDPTLQFWIDQAKLTVSQPYWLAKYDLGVAVLAAHYLTLRARGTDNSMLSGPVSQEKVGDLQQSYATPTADIGDVAMATTSYGQWYLNLKKDIITTPQLV